MSLGHLGEASALHLLSFVYILKEKCGEGHRRRRPGPNALRRVATLEQAMLPAPGLLTSMPSVVKWPGELPLDAELTACLGGQPLPHTRNKATNNIIHLPPTGKEGLMVVQPFRGPGADRCGVVVQPAGPALYLIGVTDPLLMEEVEMFVKKAVMSTPDEEEHEEEENEEGARASRDGAPATLHDDWDWASVVFPRGYDEPQRLGREIVARWRRRGKRMVARGELASDSTAGATMARGAATRVQDAVLWIAHQMFDDDCGVDDLVSGCEMAGDAGLFRLLQRLGSKLVDKAEELAHRDPERFASFRSVPSCIMQRVAMVGCPESLRSLFTVIGLAEERWSGLGEVLFGNPSTAVGVLGCELGWTPLHTAAVMTSSPAIPASTATQCCTMLLSCARDPHVWMHGCVALGDGGCLDRGEMARIGSAHFPTPNKIASQQVREGMRDFVEAAVSVAVESVASASTVAAAANAVSSVGMDLFDDALELCMTSSKDPDVVGMASIILSNRKCQMTLMANHWLVSNHRHAVCMLMSHLGWVSPMVQESPVRQGVSIEKSYEALSVMREGQVGNRRKRTSYNDNEMLPMGLKMLLNMQPPWHTKRWHMLTFMDDKLEFEWKESRKHDIIAGENLMMGILATGFIIIRLARGDCSFFLTAVGNLQKESLVFLPLIYTLIVIIVSKLSLSVDVRHALHLCYLMSDIALPHKEIRPFCKGDVPNENRSLFDSTALSDFHGRGWLGLLILQSLVPYFFSLTIDRHIFMQPLLMLIAHIRFGNSFLMGGCGMFSQWQDVVVRVAAFWVIATFMYTREYFSRSHFLKKRYSHAHLESKEGGKLGKRACSPEKIFWKVESFRRSFLPTPCDADC